MQEYCMTNQKMQEALDDGTWSIYQDFGICGKQYSYHGAMEQIAEKMVVDQFLAQQIPQPQCMDQILDVSRCMNTAKRVKSIEKDFQTFSEKKSDLCNKYSQRFEQAVLERIFLT